LDHSSAGFLFVWRLKTDKETFCTSGRTSVWRSRATHLVELSASILLVEQIARRQVDFADLRLLLAACGNESLTIVAAFDNRVDGNGAVVCTCVNELVVSDVNAAVRYRPATLHREIKPVSGSQHIVYRLANPRLVPTMPREHNPNLPEDILDKC
jgi:hypothetical protein